MTLSPFTFDLQCPFSGPALPASSSQNKGRNSVPANHDSIPLNEYPFQISCVLNILMADRSSAPKQSCRKEPSNQASNDVEARKMYGERWILTPLCVIAFSLILVSNPSTCIWKFRKMSVILDGQVQTEGPETTAVCIIYFNTENTKVARGVQKELHN